MIPQLAVGGEEGAGQGLGVDSLPLRILAVATTVLLQQADGGAAVDAGGDGVQPLRFLMRG